MKDKRKRRRCRNCGARVNLIIFARNGRKYIKCPNCFSECQFYNQYKYEQRKKS